jgi:phospholipid-binding lipoprotein MlaA
MALLTWCSACVAPESESVADNDPIEAVNRPIFEANMAADRFTLKPVAQAYQDHVPPEIRTGLHNALRNLKEPNVAVNDLLQGNPDRAWGTVRRLAINTTLGAAGVFDVATGWNLPGHDSDFGQTLAIWGLGEGPFLELPLLGPSNPRDVLGSAVDLVLDPLTFIGPAGTYVSVARGGSELVDTRSRHIDDLDAVERGSIDFYATLRSIHQQQRDAQIREAKKEPYGRLDIYFPATQHSMSSSPK